MTTEIDVLNEALQSIGTRTTVTSLTEQSNEAIQASLVIDKLRDRLNRMAPWNCARNYANLTLITAAPGTPENPSSGTTMWQKGIPPPNWAYEYQYPVDCIRPLFINPALQTGFTGGVPITTAVTGGSPSFWNGPPVKFSVGIDQFFVISSVPTIVSAGTLYNVGDVITLTPPPSPQMGAPGQLQVTSIGSGGAITGIGIYPITYSAYASITPATPVGGSYFQPQINPLAAAFANVGPTNVPSVGTGATFNCVTNTTVDQRVILTNQEFATLCYLRQIINVNVMDQLFLDAWQAILASRLAIALTGDKSLANMKVAEANNLIQVARTADGNESLTINDVTPDWIRVRGIAQPDWGYSPNQSFDYGPLFEAYG